LDHILATLDFSAAVTDVRVGLFHTAVVTRHCGLAATLPRDALRQDPPLVREPGLLLNQTSEALVRLAYSGSLVEAAIGMAAINSLLEVNEQACTELNAAELILQKGEGRNVAIVGHFPFLARVREKARRLWVIERNPGRDDLSENHADTVIPRADVVGITGTALTNHTLEHLLDLCRPRAYVLMLGDTVPLCPVLFDYGVDALAGTRVVDTERVLHCICQGATFRQIKGVRRLVMRKDAGEV
jgi:uncharacterized protein (DUF4213/DUF364 family)